MVFSFRAGNRTSWKFFWSYFLFYYLCNQGSCILIVAKEIHASRPLLTALYVKLVASVIRAWWGGGGEGDTTLLNNCGATQVKNSKVSLEGTAILLRQHGRNSF